MSHVTSVATATATNAVTGNPEPEWATDRVITPVIVPGLAANRISGVNEDLSLEAVPAVLPRSMENPIHTSTPPPATLKMSSEIPKRFSTGAPTNEDHPHTAGLISDSTVMQACK